MRGSNGSCRAALRGVTLVAILGWGCLPRPVQSEVGELTSEAAAMTALAPVFPAEVVLGEASEVSFSAGLESSHVLQGSDGQTYLVVDLAAPRSAALEARPPMAVALVIDRSGSMAGEKILQARQAAASFIEGLAEGDVVALFAYDDVIEQLAPPTILSPASRPALIAATSRLFARGSTNLQGGLVAGVQALIGAAAEGPLRRVVLISDGHANVGPSTPFELGHVAAMAASQGISVTAIGVGQGYNEAVMDAVAVRSGGRFYHLSQASQLAAILQSELHSLSSTVAYGVEVLLLPQPGVEILGASGADLERQGALVRLNVGDLMARQSRQVILPVRVPTEGALVSRDVARLTLRYRAADTEAVVTHDARVGYQLSATGSEVLANLRPDYAAAVEQHRAAQAQLEAAQLLGQGQVDRAAARLEAQAALSARRAEALGGRVGARIHRNVSALRSRSGQVRSARSAGAARGQQLELNQEALRGQGY